MICWKIRIFAYWTTPRRFFTALDTLLWFAEKFVSLLIEQHLASKIAVNVFSCDLLKNSYLCLLNNTAFRQSAKIISVVICWKIRIFAYWTTPPRWLIYRKRKLWFAEKFVSLLIEQHQKQRNNGIEISCDLLKNSYLCLLNNTLIHKNLYLHIVVICWKIRIFAYWTTPAAGRMRYHALLWFAEKFVSLLIEQHLHVFFGLFDFCCDLLKNSYLCLLNNTLITNKVCKELLWFAEKFVSLLIEQHRLLCTYHQSHGCDLLKNSYLCLLNNTYYTLYGRWSRLWFAEKFVSLLIEQHLITLQR